MQIVLNKHHIAIALFYIGLWIPISVKSYFDSVALTKPSNNPSEQYTCCDNSSTVINNIEVRQTDPLTLHWLYEKASEGPIEELSIVKKNRGFYEQLLKAHIQKLLYKRAANRYFMSRGFICCSVFAAFFALWTKAVSCPTFKDLYNDYIDTNPHSFPIINTLLALLGPVGLLKSIYCALTSTTTYQDRINARIERDQWLLQRIQAMGGSIYL